MTIKKEIMERIVYFCNKDEEFRQMYKELEKGEADFICYQNAKKIEEMRPFRGESL